MNAHGPPKEKPLLGGEGLRKPTTFAAYHVWELKANRLLTEFRRTGDPKHLNACATHVAAMRVRLFDRIANERRRP
jgi:hypothetical protein